MEKDRGLELHHELIASNLSVVAALRAQGKPVEDHHIQEAVSVFNRVAVSLERARKGAI
jgi:hypothetical protein